MPSYFPAIIWDFRHRKSGATLLFLPNKIQDSQVSSLQNKSVRKPNRRVWLIVIAFFFSCLILESLVFLKAENYLLQQNLYDTVCIKSKSTLSV